MVSRQDGHAPCVAVTGATGFLGRHLVPALAARGFRLRILARDDRARPHWESLAVETARGQIEDAPSLAALVTGADVVIHMAGLTKARSRREFLAVNRDGAARLGEAVSRYAPRAHLIGISSLVARAPQLSAYAESKRAGEQALAATFTGRLTILRPPVIYGPWDRATLDIFRTAMLPIIPIPGPREARIAMIHAADAAAAITALADGEEAPGSLPRALADTRPDGYSPREILTVAAEALGRRPRFLPLPAVLLRLSGQASSLLSLLRRKPMIFGSGKAREMAHPDWAVAFDELLPAAIAVPNIGLRCGFAATVAWYRQEGWLA
jgi:2-alkyl-3-oxoalkanoate reductase